MDGDTPPGPHVPQTGRVHKLAPRSTHGPSFRIHTVALDRDRALSLKDYASGLCALPPPSQGRLGTGPSYRASRGRRPPAGDPWRLTPAPVAGKLGACPPPGGEGGHRW